MGTLNHLKLLHYFPIVFELVTYDEYWARWTNFFASLHSNIPYCAASQSMVMKGGAKQSSGTPAPLFTGAHQSPRREAGEEPPWTCERP